ncbi:MAG: neutral/alkaline non-lysosomal ceramidase N-terminal domain-containing protein, partial [Armatimonadota bacterium]
MAAKKGTEPSSTGRPHVEYTASWREKGSVPFFGVHPCSAETLRVAGKQHGLRAGACAVVITPPEDMQPVFLAGFRPGNRLSEGVHDDLYARALALSDGSTTLVLMALDLIGYTQAESRPLRREISAIPDANIILAATHTHSGPDTIGLWGPSLLESGVDEAYLSWLRERAKEAILGAVEDLAPADLTFGSEALSDGIVKNTRAPDALDREVSVLRAARPDGSTVGTLVNFAAHAEILLHENRLISADFPHYLCQRIEAEVGGTAMFLNGALGGMVT